MQELLDKSIESLITKLLMEKPFYSAELIKKVQEVRNNTPKQSVYLALKKLKQKEIITIAGKIISLHQVWLERMRKMFEQSQNNYAYDSTSANFLKLRERESITYQFNNSLSLDIFWAHAFMFLLSNMAKEKNILLYNPHEWFLISRNESEVGLMDEVKKRNIFWIALIAGKTELDNTVKKYFDGENKRVYLLGKEIFSNNYYANCFGNIIIEVWLDKKTAGEIDLVYKSGSKDEKDAAQKIHKIIEQKNTNNKMRISKNTAKAEKIRKIFRKYFIGI